MSEHRAVVSASPDYLGDALRELRGARNLERLGPGVELVGLAKPFDEWAERLIREGPTFARHVCPVHAVAALSRDLVEYRRVVHTLVDRFEPGSPFAAQINLVDASLVGRHQLRATAHEMVTEARGLEVSVPDPEQVLSVVVADGTAYLGVSSTPLNLSAWPGGMRRYARQPDQVSRSEFKLLEAIESFGIDLSRRHLALDLGAAPGGWTRILAGEGVRVVAIDPGDLHPRVVSDDRVTYHKLHVQRLETLGLSRVDLVVNDMRMDARDSARAMTRLTQVLSSQGDGVMTLKLPKRNAVATLRAALDILRTGYTVAGVRQLFHNRSEVTAHLTW